MHSDMHCRCVDTFQGVCVSFTNYLMLYDMTGLLLAELLSSYAAINDTHTS